MSSSVLRIALSTRHLGIPTVRAVLLAVLTLTVSISVATAAVSSLAQTEQASGPDQVGEEIGQAAVQGRSGIMLPTKRKESWNSSRTPNRLRSSGLHRFMGLSSTYPRLFLRC